MVGEIAACDCDEVLAGPCEVPEDYFLDMRLKSRNDFSAA
jgi:hypothetical protein